MSNHINTPVADVVSKLSQCYQQGKTLTESIYTDDIWNLQVALTSNGLMFRAAFIYKSGKSDFNDISINAQGQISESNPQVKVRKDLIEKMEYIANGFYTNKSQKDKNKEKQAIYLRPAAIYRHYDELPDNIAIMTVDERKALAEQFINTDINSGELSLDTAHKDSNKLVLEFRIKDSYLSIIQDALENLRATNREIDRNIQNKIVEDLIQAELDAKKTIQVIIKDLRYLVEDYTKENYSTPDTSRLQRNLDRVYGYILYNKSNEPIQFEHISYLTGQKLCSFGVINPCESIALSCAEAANLLSGTTINTKISNAILTQSSRKANNKIEFRNRAQLRIESNSNAGSIRHKDVMTLPENQWERFLDISDLLKNRIDKILRLVFPEVKGLGKYNYLTVSMYIMERVLKNRGTTPEAITGALGSLLTDVLEINGKKVQINVTQNANSTYNINIKKDKKGFLEGKKSILGMFKR